MTNRYGQLWEVPNVFAVGASLFPQNPSFNPTETICALAYHTSDAVRRHLGEPDVLMG